MLSVDRSFLPSCSRDGRHCWAGEVLREGVDGESVRSVTVGAGGGVSVRALFCCCAPFSKSSISSSSSISAWVRLACNVRVGSESFSGCEEGAGCFLFWPGLSGAGAFGRNILCEEGTASVIPMGMPSGISAVSADEPPSATTTVDTRLGGGGSGVVFFGL